MGIATTHTFEPVFRTRYLDRLAAFRDAPGPAAVLWDDVHRNVQANLTRLEKKVRDEVRGVRVDAGSTQGERFILFSYRTFSLPDNEIDPVVAGVIFTLAGDGVKVEADLSGEQTGDYIASFPSTIVENSNDAVIEAARDALRLLCEAAGALAAAVTDPARIVE